MKIKQLFRDVPADGTQVKVNGWIRTLRISKNFGFIELNDGSFFKNLQIVIEADSLSNFAEVAKLNVGSALRVEGTLVLTPQAKQPFGIKASAIEVEGASTPDYPLQKSVIRLNICARFRICVRVQTRLRQRSAFVRLSHTQYTNSLTKEVLYTFTLRS